MTQTFKTVSELTTKELVAEYNQLTGKSIKKFADRATGEKQVLKARMAQTTFKAEEPSYVYGFEVHHQTNCPHCNIDLRNGVGQHGDDVNGKALKLNTNQFFCLGCGAEFGPLLRKIGKSTTRSSSISESWNNREIAEKRSQRYAVKVTGKSTNGQLKVGTEFSSTLKAFQYLNLDTAKHIAFRMNLVEAGTLAHPSGYVFAIVK